MQREYVSSGMLGGFWMDATRDPTAEQPEREGGIFEWPFARSGDGGDDSDGSPRRRFLALLGAIIATVSASVGIRLGGFFEIFDGDDASERRPRDRSNAHIFVIERGGTYEAFNADGTTLSEGMDGWQVLSEGFDAVAAGGSIYIDGHYDYNPGQQIEVRKDITVEASTAVFEHAEVDEFMFRFRGEQIISGRELDATARQGDRVIAVSERYIDRGDTIHVYSDASIVRAGADNIPIGEGHIVEAVSEQGYDGETSVGLGEIRLGEPLQFSYDSADDARVSVMEPVTVHWIGGEFLGHSIDAQTERGIQLEYCTHSTVVDIWSDEIGKECINVEDCYKVRIHNCHIQRAMEQGDGYGIATSGAATHLLVTNCQFQEMRHAIETSAGQPDTGLTRDLLISNCTFTGGNQSGLCDTHHGTISWNIHDCVFDAEAQCITAGALINRFVGNTFHRGQVESKSAIMNRMDGFRWIENDEAPVDSIQWIIQNNTFRGYDRAIRLRNQERNELLQFQGNVIRGGISRSLSIENPIERALITNNYFEGATGHCIEVREAGYDGRLDIPFHGVRQGFMSGNYFGNTDTDSEVRIGYGNMAVVNNFFMAGSDDEPVSFGSSVNNGFAAMNSIYDPAGYFPTSTAAIDGGLNVQVEANFHYG